MFNGAIKFLTIIFLICKVEGNDEKCILNECICSLIGNIYNIKCLADSSKRLTFNQIPDSIKNYHVSLKLKGRKYMDLLKNSQLSEKIQVNSLDLSFNNENFENYLYDLNRFGANLFQLNISYNKITRLDAEQFNNLSMLISLDLSNNQLFYFEQNAFFGLNCLNYMNLENNRLSELLNHFFENLNQLESLNLNRNSIIKIRNDSLSRLYALKNISLKYNKIKIIESHAFINLNQSENIWLTKNRLVGNVDHVVWPFFSISKVSISLDLSYNRLKSFKTNALLNNLNLKSNLINSFTLPAYNITFNGQFYNVLKMFSLENNKLEFIPENVFIYLNRMFTLNVGNNLIKEINKKSLNGLVVIKTINISFNQLTILKKDTFVSAKTLNNLFLQNNKIEIIESGAFSSLVNLTFMNLQNNQIKYLTSDSLSGLNFLNSLRILNISNNPIEIIETNLIEKFIFLDKFILENSYSINQLSRKNFTNLTMIYFQGLIYPNVLQKAENLKYLFLSHCRLDLRNEKLSWKLTSLSLNYIEIRQLKDELKNLTN